MTRSSNLAASIAARLLARARASGEDYQNLLLGYCLEPVVDDLRSGTRHHGIWQPGGPKVHPATASAMRPKTPRPRPMKRINPTEPSRAPHAWTK
jgi:hypothetical protein